MAVASIQDRTSEFKSVLAQAQRKQSSSKVSSQRRSLLTDAQKDAANSHAGGPPRRSEFARKAAEIGRGISATMGKLEKLAQYLSKLELFKRSPNNNTPRPIRRASTTRMLSTCYKASSLTSRSTSRTFLRPEPRTSRHRDREQRTLSPLCRNMLSHRFNSRLLLSTEHQLETRPRQEPKIPCLSTPLAINSC
ncbi:hypothetical protein LB505_007746 [Fusarium chuoi]|nr:hypothetical protein LB505_007746 [Fusarium chuoi]